MEHPFNNQVTLITGAGSGIGRAVAMEMARQGSVIAAVDLHAEPLESLITELKAANLAGAWEMADVTDRSALAHAAAVLERRLGPIEILVANAGIGLATPARSFQALDVERQIAVNLMGVVNSIEAVLPGMLARGRGRLVAISSLASYRGLPSMAGYCASKAGVNNLMDSLRIELRRHGIHCTTICPGWIRTPLAERALDLVKATSVFSPHMLEADDAARRIVKAIQRQRAFVAFPLSARLILTLLRSLPTGLADWLVRFLVKSKKR
jgi:short-subunit dehydrogenase